MDSIALSEQGNRKVEKMLRNSNLISKDSKMYDIQNIQVVHFISQSLRAHKLMKRDVDSIIKDNKGMSRYVDSKKYWKEFGRIAVGRKFSNDLKNPTRTKRAFLHWHS